LFWDLSGLPRARLEDLWHLLKEDSEADAALAVRRLAALPNEAVPFVLEKIKPLPAIARKIDILLAELGDDRFPIREEASSELEKLGREAEPALRRVAEVTPSAEVRRRAEELLYRLGQERKGDATPEQQAGLRAIKALEQIGSAAAVQVLKTLVEG